MKIGLLDYNFLSPELYSKFYKDITDFRTAFGLPIGQNTLSVQAVQLHFGLFREEMRELFSAETRVDKIDAVIDTLYVMFGHLVQGAKSSCVTDLYAPELNLIDTLLAAGEELNFSILDAWDIVHKSNMSKLCVEDNLEETLNYYKYIGVDVTHTTAGQLINNDNGLVLFVVKVKSDSTDTNGKFYPTGKVLKSIDYVPADLSEL